MKKIMFNDKFYLTRAVIEEYKTMTRRIIPNNVLAGCIDAEELLLKSTYKIGEVVAVAQAYGSDDFCKRIPLLHGVGNGTKEEAALIGNYKTLKGFNNKMFVRADLMPYKIKVTDIQIERLQDISEEDCMKEGIRKSNKELIIGYPFGIPFNYYFEQNEEGRRYTTAREAFSVLIDKVSKKGTWNSNPMVYVYEFKLMK